MAIEQLWPRVLDIVRITNVINWEPLCTTIESWAYPRTGNLEISTEIYDELKTFAARVLSDIVSIAEDRPGVRHWSLRVAEHLDVEIEITLDSDFEALYPARDFGNDLQVVLGRQTEAVRELATDWVELDPAQVAPLDDGSGGYVRAGRHDADLLRVRKKLLAELVQTSAFAAKVLEGHDEGNNADDYRN